MADPLDHLLSSSDVFEAPAEAKQRVRTHHGKLVELWNQLALLIRESLETHLPNPTATTRPTRTAGNPTPTRPSQPGVTTPPQKTTTKQTLLESLEHLRNSGQLTARMRKSSGQYASVIKKQPPSET